MEPPGNPGRFRQAGNPGRGDLTASGRQPEGLGLLIELSPRHACVGAGRAVRRIDAHALRPAEIDHQAAIAHGTAGDVVPASADCHDEIVSPGKVDASHHIRCAGTAGDQRRVPIDHAIPDLACPILAVVRAQQQPAAQSVSELFHERFAQDDLRARRS